jgi:hypothetical protein
MNAKRERRLLDVPAQTSPTDPNGEHKDHGQRQCWSELDAEQDVGQRSDAEAVLEAHAFQRRGSWFQFLAERGFPAAPSPPCLLLAANRLRIHAIRLTVSPAQRGAALTPPKARRHCRKRRPRADRTRAAMAAAWPKGRR